MAKKLTQKEAEDRCLKSNRILLEKYKGSHKKHWVECIVCERIDKIVLVSVFFENNGCHNCAAKKRAEEQKDTLEDLQKHAIKNNGECKSIEYINCDTKYHWYCNIHKLDFYNTWDHIKNGGQWCSLCGIERSAEKQKLNEEDVRILLKEKNITLEDKEYKSVGDKSNLSCDTCGGRWSALIGPIIYRGIGCPICNQSKSEKYCRETIEYLTQKKFSTVRPKWLRNPKTNYPLELDGYNKELKIAFEHQGKRHFKPCDFYGGEKALEEMQYRDELKRKKCKEKGILLLEPNYKMSEKEILRYFYVNISKFLRNHKYPFYLV